MMALSKEEYIEIRHAQANGARHIDDILKMTSIVGYIAVQYLTKIGDIIRSRTFDALFPLLLISLIYFLLAWAFSAVLDFIGRKTK